MAYTTNGYGACLNCIVSHSSGKVGMEPAVHLPDMVTCQLKKGEIEKKAKGNQKGTKGLTRTTLPTKENWWKKKRN